MAAARMRVNIASRKGQLKGELTVTSEGRAHDTARPALPPPPALRTPAAPGTRATAACGSAGAGRRADAPVSPRPRAPRPRGPHPLPRARGAPIPLRSGDRPPVPADL